MCFSFMGGTTPFTQVNDTHLHALVQRIMEQLENGLAHSQRKEWDEAGLPQRTPELKRPDIINCVMGMWLQLNHKNIAAKGYRQTGPGMPLTGPVRYQDVYKDLRTVWEQIDPSDDALYMGTSIRQAAKDYVQVEWDAKRATEWRDVWKLIEEHDDEDEPDVEGMEAYQWEPYDDDADDRDGGQGDSEDDIFDRDSGDERDEGGEGGGPPEEENDEGSNEDGDSPDDDGDGGAIGAREWDHNADGEDASIFGDFSPTHDEEALAQSSASASSSIVPAHSQRDAPAHTVPAEASGLV